MPWWDYAREHYLGLTDDTPPTETTLYYDPTIDLHHRLPVSLAMTTSYYAAPQVPDEARRLFEAASTAMGLDGDLTLPLPAGRGWPSALVLAREWNMVELASKLQDAIDASFEPTWNDELGEFTWRMGLDEPHPRGQYNAFLAAAEASGPGRWERLSAGPIEPQPQIVDVDFPTLALHRAEWIAGNLFVGLSPVREDPDVYTTFRITGIEPRLWSISGIDNATMDFTADAVIVRVPLVCADIEFTHGSY